jgi:UDP-glucuronate decarboxylase
MKYLVCGGFGFIGKNLVKFLLSKGYEVEIWDNLITGIIDETLLSENNEDFVSSRIHFEKVDILDIWNQEYKFLIETKFDGIFNLACAASPEKYQSDPIHTTLTSVVGVNNLLKLADIQKIPFLQASTSEIYGEPLENPQNEEYRGNVNPIGIRSCYDEGKRCAESLCFDYLRKYGTSIKIARIFNTYGPLMDPQDGRVISNFINQCLLDKPITIYGTGEQTRSFCYVDDLVEGLYRLIISNISGPVNLGNPEEYSINMIAVLVKNLTNSDSEIVHLDLPLDDPTQRKPDISLAIGKLGWTPHVDLIDGLLKTIDYFKGEL